MSRLCSSHERIHEIKGKDNGCRQINSAEGAPESGLVEKTKLPCLQLNPAVVDGTLMISCHHVPFFHKNKLPGSGSSFRPREFKATCTPSWTQTSIKE
jgi:hypothetical protein